MTSFPLSINLRLSLIFTFFPSTFCYFFDDCKQNVGPLTVQTAFNWVVSLKITNEIARTTIGLMIYDRYAAFNQPTNITRMWRRSIRSNLATQLRIETLPSTDWISKKLLSTHYLSQLFFYLISAQPPAQKQSAVWSAVARRRKKCFFFIIFWRFNETRIWLWNLSLLEMLWKLRHADTLATRCLERKRKIFPSRLRFLNKFGWIVWRE